MLCLDRRRERPALRFQLLRPGARSRPAQAFIRDTDTPRTSRSRGRALFDLNGKARPVGPKPNNRDASRADADRPRRKQDDPSFSCGGNIQAAVPFSKESGGTSAGGGGAFAAGGETSAAGGEVFAGGGGASARSGEPLAAGGEASARGGEGSARVNGLSSREASTSLNKRTVGQQKDLSGRPGAEEDLNQIPPVVFGCADQPSRVFRAAISILDEAPLSTFRFSPAAPRFAQGTREI